MAYSRSLRVVERNKNYLDQLVEGEEAISWVTQDPNKLAFAIREAINVSKRHALDKDKQPVEPYFKYARLLQKYAIRVAGSRVIATPREVFPIEAVRESMSKMVLRDIEDEMSILGAAIQHKADEMFFPDATEKSCDLPSLYNWTSKNGYFIIVADEGITLTRKDVGELAWQGSS